MRELLGSFLILENSLAQAYINKSTQMHVSLAGPNYMKVSWMTSDKSVPATVEYGIQSGNLLQSATGVSKSYTFVTYESGQMHHVKLGPLLDSTTYFYRCGGFGPEYNFTTPPPSGPSVPIKFAVVGDLGQTDWTASTLQHVAAQGYDVLLFAGDLSYADYVQPRWDTFGKMMSPYANYKPWMVTEGNHEEEQIPLLVKSFLAYNTRWEMPYNESGSNSNLYYSFEVAGVHVLMLGSYTEFDSNSAQYKWLQVCLSFTFLSLSSKNLLCPRAYSRMLKAIIIPVIRCINFSQRSHLIRFASATHGIKCKQAFMCV
jgi:hypothetical protein